MEVRSRDQSIPWMKSKRQLAWYKHACHPRELLGACWLIGLLLSPFLCKWGRKRQSSRKTGIYISLDQTPGWQLNRCHSSQEEAEEVGEVQKESKNEGGGKSVSVTPQKRKEKL